LSFLLVSSMSSLFIFNGLLLHSHHPITFLLLEFLVGLLNVFLFFPHLFDLVLNLVFGLTEEPLSLRVAPGGHLMYLKEHFLELVTELEQVLSDLSLLVEHEEGLTRLGVIVQACEKEAFAVAFIQKLNDLRLILVELKKLKQL